MSLTVRAMIVSVVWSGLLVALGCGSETAQPDDVIIAPDPQVLVVASPGGTRITAGPLVFKVQDPKNKNAPVPGVLVELFTSTAGTVTPTPSPPTPSLPILTDENKNCLNTSQCERFKIKTDNQGVVAVYVTVTVPASNATADIATSYEVTALTTSSQVKWRWTVTVTKP